MSERQQVPHAPPKNKTWLHSEPALNSIRRLAQPLVITPRRVTTSAIEDIRDRVRKNLENYYASEEESETSERNQEATRFDNSEDAAEIPFVTTDPNDLANALRVVRGRVRPISGQTPRRASFREESSDTSYDSDIFDPNELDQMPVLPVPATSADEVEDRAMSVAIDREIANMSRSITATSERGSQRTRDNPAPLPENTRSNPERNVTDRPGMETDRIVVLLEQLIEGVEEIKNMSATTMRLVQENTRIALNDIAPIEAYGRESYGIPRQEANNGGRNINIDNHANLREAKDYIPTFDGSNEGKLMEFLTACDYAFEIIHPADEAALVRAIICTKLKGIALIEIKNRNPQSYPLLKSNLEACYARKKSTTRLQREFNYAKQLPGEEARVFGKRIETLAAELFTATTEGSEYSEREKITIHSYIKQQALVN